MAIAEHLRKTAILVRDLLNVDEQLIRIGRLNYELPNFVDPYIGVDSLGGSRVLSRSTAYDGEAEIIQLSSRLSAPVTVTFYNVNTDDRASDFALLLRSQQALELQESLGITVFPATNITDVKLLTGSEYNERVEVELNIHYNITKEISTLRIDEAQINLLTENKEVNI